MTRHVLRSCAVGAATSSPVAPCHAGTSACLSIACVFATLPNTNRAWSSLPEFSALCEMLFCTKQPSAADLQVILPHVWWTECQEPGLSQASADRCLAQLSATVKDIQLMYVRLVEALLTPTAGTSTGGFQSTAGQFRRWLHTLLEKNAGATRHVPPAGLSDSSVLSNVFFALLHLLSDHLKVCALLLSQVLRS